VHILRRMGCGSAYEGIAEPRHWLENARTGHTGMPNMRSQSHVLRLARAVAFAITVLAFYSAPSAAEPKSVAFLRPTPLVPPHRAVEAACTEADMAECTREYGQCLDAANGMTTRRCIQVYFLCQDRCRN